VASLTFRAQGGAWLEIMRSVDVRVACLDSARFLYSSSSYSGARRLGIVQKMASTLTDEMRALSKVTSAILAGEVDEPADVNVDRAQGELLSLTRSLNVMPHQLRMLVNELTCVALEVGKEVFSALRHAFRTRRACGWCLARRREYRAVSCCEREPSLTRACIPSPWVLTVDVKMMVQSATNLVRSVAEVTRAAT
jgi:hypothetical protein